MSLQAFYDLAFLTGAFQAEAETEAWAFQQCVFQADAFQADICTPVVPDDHAGGGAIFPPGWYGRNRQRRQEAVELEELLESAPLPVQSAIRTQSRARLESMEADERAIRAAAEAARIEWDAFYMRLLAYQREEALIEEEAIVMTMIAALSE